jgi:hypothetical protein
VSRRVHLWLAAVALLLLALGAIAPPVASAVTCGIGSCPGPSAPASSPIDDLGRLGDSCDDHGHCADHVERTAVGALAVAALTLTRAVRSERRNLRGALAPRAPFAGNLFRPPRTV